MRQPLPPMLRPRDGIASIREDIAPYRGLTDEELSATMSRRCGWAMDAILHSPDPDRLLRWRDERSPESRELWRSLVARYRK